MGLWQLNLKSHSIASLPSLYTVCWVHSRVVYIADDSRVSIFSFRLASFRPSSRTEWFRAPALWTAATYVVEAPCVDLYQVSLPRTPCLMDTFMWPPSQLALRTSPSPSFATASTFWVSFFRLSLAQRKLLANEEIEKYLQTRLSEKQFHQFNLISPRALTRANVDTRFPAGLKVNNLME